jgi:hypothetical protein
MEFTCYSLKRTLGLVIADPKTGAETPASQVARHDLADPLLAEGVRRRCAGSTYDEPLSGYHVCPPGSRETSGRHDASDVPSRCRSCVARPG